MCYAINYYVRQETKIWKSPDPLPDKELHELIQTIERSGYFDKPSAAAEEEEEEDLVRV